MELMKMYFVAIVLPAELDRQILQYKKWMAEKYGCKVGLKSPAHITIAAPFWMQEEREDNFKNDTTYIAGLHQAIHISTNNFSAFKPRTLFVAVKESEQLQKLKQDWDNHLSTKDYNMKIENRPFHPHITIATRDLLKTHFWEAWSYFETKTFEKEFEAKGLSLLKHNGSKWDVVYRADFLTA